MTRQEASVLSWLRSKMTRRPAPPVSVPRPPGRHKAVARAISEAFRAPFAPKAARPVRRAPLFEPLEPRVLLSVELPVIPPQPNLQDPVLSAPLELAASLTGAQAPPLLQGFDRTASPLPDLAAQAAEVFTFGDDWGALDLRGDQDGAELVLDFSSVTKDLQFTVRADGTVDITDGENTVSAANVERLVGGAGNDTYVFTGTESASV
ncbi:MAG: LEPR-XLL domain-containing protein, partial [Betaproteobacteria bacterium]